ncbi:MAG TPA: DUF1801 domain-containing protein [Catenuloplanes sp.]|jgi:hypothetical protein
MATLKTARTDASVDGFLAGVADEGRRRDAEWVRELLARITGAPAAMWGESIVGFGERRLRYASGRELDWFLVGFSPRKQNLTVYLGDGGFGDEDLLARLGRHTVGKGCLYLKRVDDVDPDVLAELITRSLPPAAPD